MSLLFGGKEFKGEKEVAREIQAAVDEERERCAKIADACVPTGPSPIGVMYGAGIAGTATHIAKLIRSGWK